MEHRNSGVQSSKLKLNAAKLPLETSINDGKVCQNGPYTLPHTLMAFGHLISPPPCWTNVKLLPTPLKTRCSEHENNYTSSVINLND